MKRLIFAIIIILVTCTLVYAQQGTAASQTSEQIRRDAQQFLNQTRTNNNEFQSTLDDLKARNLNNRDAYNFNRLRTDIQRIEATINDEERAIRANLDRGTRVNSQVMDRYESFINQHTAKIQELEDFLAN